jgi:hypothetical protein
LLVCYRPAYYYCGFLTVCAFCLVTYTVKTRRVIETVLPGMVDIDVDLELDETKEKEKESGKDV